MTKRYAMGSYVAGAGVARTGDEMSGPALLLAGFAVTGSASTASLLLAGIMISAAIGGPLFGVLLDRSARPGRLLAGALAAYASALIVLLVSLGRIPVVIAVLIAVCAGVLGPALSGGWTSQLPRVVPHEKLDRANAIDSMTFNVAGLAGPPLAGIVAELYGAPVGLLVAAGLICLALPSALALPPSSARPVPGSSIAAELAAGFRAIVRARGLVRATATSVISCVGQGMLIACCPLLGAQALGAADRGTILLSVLAVSALMANAMLARRPRLMRPDTIIWCSTLVLAVGLVLAATGRPALLIAGAVFAGVGDGPQLTALFAVRHREAPGRLRGQVFTTGASLKVTGFALGAAIAGPIATWSLPGALLAAAGFQALAGLSFACLSRTRVRQGEPSLHLSPAGPFDQGSAGAAGTEDANEDADGNAPEQRHPERRNDRHEEGLDPGVAPVLEDEHDRQNQQDQRDPDPRRNRHKRVPARLRRLVCGIRHRCPPKPSVTFKSLRVLVSSCLSDSHAGVQPTQRAR